MGQIFKDFAHKYYDAGIIPIPLVGKRPIIKEWQNVGTYKDIDGIVSMYPNCNIGALLGASTGIIAVDIDKDSAIALCPPSPVRKKGAKGETRFFRYNGEQAKKRHDIGIEILSTGNQTVLPPSIHPETNSEYRWITPDTLLDVKPDDLPTLPEDFLSGVYQSQKKTEIRPSDGTRCNHGSHDALSAMLVAGLHAGDTPETIVKSLIDYDEKINTNISYFLCPSRKWKTSSKPTNALSFVLEGVIRNLKNGNIDKINLEQSSVVLDTNIIENKKIERLPLPHLRGFGQDLFEIAYKGSYVARSHFTFPAILSIGAIVMANKIQFQGIHPNIYCLLAGDSGSGKSSALDFIKDFLQECGIADKFLGDGSPSGDTALIQNLPLQRERIDIIDEGDSLFLTINSINSYGKKLADTYASLFTSPGKYFLGKFSSAYKEKGNERGNVGGCFSPNVSMILGLTFKAFEQSVTEHTIDKGFGARILYFADNERKKKKVAKRMPIPQEIKDTVKMWADRQKIEIDQSINLTQNHYAREFKIREAGITDKGQELLDKYLNELDELAYNEPRNSKILSILNRSGEYLKKISLIDAFFTQPHTTNLVINEESVEWAMQFTRVHIQNAKIFIEGHLYEGQYNERVMKILKYIEDRKEVTKADISNVFRKIPKKERKDIVMDLIEMGKIAEKSGKIYVVKTC